LSLCRAHSIFILSVIGFEAVVVIKVLLLLPAIILIHFVTPWFALSLNIRVLLLEFIVVIVKVVTITVRIAFILPFLLLFLELGLVAFLIVDFNEDWKSLIWSDATLSFKEVDHDAVRALLDSLPSETGFFSQSSFVAELALISQIIDTMEELASLSVHAVSIFVVLATELGLVVGWEMLLWHEFINVVSI